MSWFTSLWQRFLALVGRRVMERDMEQELAFHLEAAVEAGVRDGLTPAEARLRALRHFGGMDRVKEEIRGERGVSWIEDSVTDVRGALRQMRRRPIVTLVIVLTLAIGVGANTAMFTMVNTVVLGPLPYPAADRLVVLWSDSKSYSPGPALSAPDFFDYRDQSEVLEGVAAAWGYRVGLNSAEGDPESLQRVGVSANFFDLLRVNPAIGTSFTPEYDVPNGPGEAVLSHGLWQRRFGGDPAVLGQTVDLDSKSFVVIGVMPEGFRLWTPPETLIWAPPVDIWTNLRYGPESVPRGRRHLFTIGRLKPSATLDQANAEAQTLSAYLRTTLTRYADNDFEVTVHPLGVGVVRSHQPVLLALWGAVVLVLLITITNLSSLFLGRAVQRQGELGLRAALGAGRGRLVRQLLSETMVLSAAGGLAGLALATYALGRIKATKGQDLPLLEYASVDGVSLVVTFGTALAAGILFGIIPAVRASRIDAGQWFASRTTSGPHDRRAFRVMMVGQVALSLTLLIASGLVVRSFANLLSRDLGFVPEGVTTFTVALPPSRYDTPEKRIGFFRTLEERLEAVPGVQAVGGVNLLPLTGSGTSGHYRLGDVDERASVRTSTPGGFAAMGTRILAGRDFSDQDSQGGPVVVIIDQRLATRVWDTPQDAVGQRLVTLGEDSEVVGVVESIPYDGILDTRPAFYLPQTQMSQWNVYTMIKADDGLALGGTVRQVVDDIDPTLPVGDLRPLDDYVSTAVAEPRFAASVMSGFALAAFALACIGLYGVLSYTVSVRRREMGIRIACGARPSSMFGLVLSEGLGMVAVGTVVGVAGALFAGRLLRGMLVDVPPTDLTTFAVAGGTFAAVAVAACFIPARRAVATDPIEVLRAD